MNLQNKQKAVELIEAIQVVENRIQLLLTGFNEAFTQVTICGIPFNDEDVFKSARALAERHLVDKLSALNLELSTL